jgi:hypothetical protein
MHSLINRHIRPLYIPLFLCLLYFLSWNLTGSEKKSIFQKQQSVSDIVKTRGLISFETRYFTVYYSPSVSLSRVERKLSRRKFYTSGIERPPLGSTPDTRVAYRLDRLFLRAKELLDMNPRMKKINILILESRDDVIDEYAKITFGRKRVKSFYVKRENTIFASEEDTSDSIIAHEIGHAIVEHYFTTSPPLKIREMLASYVDMHLEEENILIE